MGNKFWESPLRPLLVFLELTKLGTIPLWKQYKISTSQIGEAMSCVRFNYTDPNGFTPTQFSNLGRYVFWGIWVLRAQKNTSINERKISPPPKLKMQRFQKVQFFSRNFWGSQHWCERPPIFAQSLDLVHSESLSTGFEWPKSVKAFSSHVSAKKKSVGQVHTNSLFYRPYR